MLFAVGVTGSGAGAMIAIGLIAAFIYGAIVLAIYTARFLKDLHTVCADAGTSIWKLVIPIVNMWSLSKIAKKKWMFVIWFLFEIVFLSIIAFVPLDYEGTLLILVAVACVYIQCGLMGRLIWIVLRGFGILEKIITSFFIGYISFIIPILLAAFVRM